MKMTLLVSVFLMGANVFACKDYSGKYIWNPDGYIPMTLEITQKGCEHVDITTKAPTAGFELTESMDCDGVIRVIEDSPKRKVKSACEFQEDLSHYEDYQFPNDPQTNFKHIGLYILVNDKILRNNFDLNLNGVHTQHIFDFIRQ